MPPVVFERADKLRSTIIGLTDESIDIRPSYEIVT